MGVRVDGCEGGWGFGVDGGGINWGARSSKRKLEDSVFSGRCDTCGFLSRVPVDAGSVFEWLAIKTDTNHL